MRTFAAILCLTTLATAQPAKKRPTVGLALSGGSAMGLAHLGVLEWLQENRVPIDYVAGTSMGALIGALYATGHSAAEIRTFIDSIDWEQAMAAAPPFRQLSYRRKEDVREYPAQLEFGLKQGPRLPSGLPPGHMVGLLLSRFAAPYSEMESFNALPTPFRCVATDLVEGKQVVLARGSLGDALRATMSYPALFAPLERDGKLLVDGGLLNNLPVDVVKGMGAEVVIAVALDPPRDRKQYRSLLGVAGRSLSVMVSDNERRNLGLADLVLMPELKGLGSSDYQKVEQFRKAGYEAAEAKRFFLEKLQEPVETWGEWLRGRLRKRRGAEVKARFVELEGAVAERRREALIAALKPDPQRPLDRELLENELTKLTGMGRFDTAGYEIIQREGKDGLRVRVHEKPQGPPFLRTAITLDGGGRQGLRLGIGGRFIFLDAGGPASEWRTDLSIGLTNRLESEYYYRLKGGKWFVAPRGFYDRADQPLYSGKRRVAEYSLARTGAAADLGYAFGRFQELRLGYTVYHLKTATVTGPAAGGRLQGRVAQAGVRWAYEGQDSALAPRRGLRSTVALAWVTDYPGVRKSFPAGELQVGYAHPFSRRYSLLWNGAVGATAQRANLASYYRLGGLGQLSSLEHGQLTGSRYYASGAYGLRSLAGQSLSLFGKFYGAIGYEAGQAWYLEGRKPRHDGVIGLLGETAIGVMFLGGAIGDRGEKKLLFRLGRLF